MLNKNRLTEFYTDQYLQEGHRKVKKLMKQTDAVKRLDALTKNLRSARASSINIRNLEEYHKQLKNVVVFAVHKKREDMITKVITMVIPKLVDLDTGVLLEEQRDGLGTDFLAYAKRTMNGVICQESLFTMYPRYRAHMVKGKILELVPSKPEMEFESVRQINRRFILHIGPTNSGKTFHSLERLKEAKNGVYLGPLRLLALEVYEKMRSFGVPCTMRTGQECIEEENSRVMSSTIEMADFDEEYDIAVIDEAQMVEDRDRGHSWTKAILGLNAKEIHVCMSPAAEPAILHLIRLCEDTHEIFRYERKTPLVCEKKDFVFPDDVQKGDALIVFSKKAVLDVAGRLEAEKINASVIYGSLPPEIRRRQMHLFNSGKTNVVVSTDAIGMGLNLPVRRIVFLQTEKYDGIGRRPLTTSEIKQIAGRAGRFGIYNSGYVNAIGEEELEYVREQLPLQEEPIKEVILGFPQVLLDIDGPLDEIMQIWHSVTVSEPFVKENIDEALYLYDEAYSWKNAIDGFQNKRTLYKMITCPIDIKDRDVVDLWLWYCRSYTADTELEKPRLMPGRRGGIAQYETYYKELDLYYQFSNRMQKNIDSAWLEDEREKTENTIMRYLTKGKKNYIAHCKYCGKLLPLGTNAAVCTQCRIRSGRGERRSR